MSRPKRAGRKSNPAAKRRQTTHEGQGRASYPTEIMRHRLVAAGADPTRLINDAVVRSMANEHGPIDPSYPLDSLLKAGLLISDGEDVALALDRHSIGLRFTALNWRIYGRPPGAQTNGYRAPMNEEEAQAILERHNRLLSSSEPPLSQEDRERLAAMQYRALRNALLAVVGSAETLSVTLRVLVYCEMPRRHEVGLLRAGLAAMVEARLPTASDVR